jgi:uncharacterized protein YqjF (DUF2071 family)
VNARAFLAAEWRQLATLNWRVDEERLRPLVPAGVELDRWGGAPHVSAVAFRFLRTRVLGIPVPLHADFDEVNLRFYVRRTVGGSIRRGVVFVRELAPSPFLAFAARALYNEPYSSAEIRHTVGAGHAEYRLARDRAEARVVVDAPPEFRDLESGSAEEFFLERHFGYVRQRDGGTLEYAVEHPPWRVTPARAAAFEGESAAFYGPAFADILRRPPDSAFLADGSPVIVRRGVRIA